MFKLLPLLTALGAGLVGGVFFAFSAFVMKALAGLPPAQGVAAMQRINAVVLNPLFLGLFVGTAGLSVGCLAGAMLGLGGPDAADLLELAGASYLAGSFGVTLACNVPRNERLARLAADSAEAAAYWPAYLREWLFWNHVRTVAAAVAALAAAAVPLV